MTACSSHNVTLVLPAAHPRREPGVDPGDAARSVNEHALGASKRSKWEPMPTRVAGMMSAGRARCSGGEQEAELAGVGDERAVGRPQLAVLLEEAFVGDGRAEADGHPVVGAHLLQ